MSTPRWKATYALFRHPESVRLARGFIAAAAAQAGFDPDAIRDIQVAVAEAVTNAYVHAYGGARRGRIEVDVAFDGTFFTIGVHDSGRPVAPGLTVPRTLPDRGTGGRGLYLMTRLMDAVEIRQPGRRGRGTLVVMTKRAPALSSPPPDPRRR